MENHAIIRDCFLETQSQLQEEGLDTNFYVIPDYDGYASVMEVPRTDVYTLESRIGRAYNRPGYSMYGVAQVFDARYPSNALILLINRRDADNAPIAEPGRYNPGVDRGFAYKFFPLMNTAFNRLDPSGQNKGVLIQTFTASLKLNNLPQIIDVSMQSIGGFKKAGQLASIAVDFDDRMMRMAASLLKPISSSRNLHYIPKVDHASSIQVPLQDPTQPEPFRLANFSTALDEGFAIAQQYLDQHYQAATL